MRIGGDMMRIGLMADTHDNVHMVDKAVKVFNEYEVSLVLHAGDIVSPFVPRWFKGLRCKLIGVFGNNENERRMLVERFGKMGHELRELRVLRLRGLWTHSRSTLGGGQGNTRD